MSKPGDDEQTLRDAENELEQAYRLPALFVNRFWVRIGRTTTRICFGESPGGEGNPNFRMSVVMPSAEALRLSTTLRALADRLQEQVEAASHPADEPHG